MLDKQLKDQYNWKLELTDNRTIEKRKLNNHERKMNEHLVSKEGKLEANIHTARCLKYRTLKIFKDLHCYSLGGGDFVL